MSVSTKPRRHGASALAPLEALPPLTAVVIAGQALTMAVARLFPGLCNNPSYPKPTLWKFEMVMVIFEFGRKKMDVVTILIRFDKYKYKCGINL
jgi:hypothetical protein